MAKVRYRVLSKCFVGGSLIDPKGRKDVYVEAEEGLEGKNLELAPLVEIAPELADNGGTGNGLGAAAPPALVAGQVVQPAVNGPPRVIAPVTPTSPVPPVEPPAAIEPSPPASTEPPPPVVPTPDPTQPPPPAEVVKPAETAKPVEEAKPAATPSNNGKNNKNK